VLLDDLQWADEATLDVLPALARALEGEPVLLVGAYRSDDIARGHPIRRLRSELRRDGRLRGISLEPLDAAATAALLEQVLEAPAAPGLRDAIGDRTDGVPFFVTELGLALAASGRLRTGAAGLELLEGEELPLPDSIRDAVLLRTAGLSPAARSAVAVAAVAGQSFDPEPVLAIAGLDEWPDEAVSSGILVDGASGQMAFRHALVRDAFYGELPLLQRRALHREVARRLDAPAQVLAEHWAQAREPEQARRRFLEAANACCAVHAYLDGARAARRGARWSCGRTARTSAGGCRRWSGSRCVRSSPASRARPCARGARWPTAAGARASRWPSPRPRAGWPARSSCRAAGTRRCPRARRRPWPSRRPERSARPPRSGWRRPPTCARRPASGPRSS
jgi:hypothetical protein